MSMEETENQDSKKYYSKKGKQVRNFSLDRFRPLNYVNGESVKEDQEVAYRDASPQAPLRYAVVKTMLDKNTCFVDLGSRKKTTIGRSLSTDKIYVRRDRHKSLGNKNEYSSEQVKPLETFAIDDLVLLKTGKDNEYRWVKIRESLPDNQYAVLTSLIHGEVCSKNELFTLINEPTIMNSSSTP